MEALEIVRKYVSGEIDSETFSNALYADSELEELLSDPSINWHETYIEARAVNLYYYLIELNFSRLGDKMNAVGALELFLQKKGISYSKNDKHTKLHSLMLDTQPKYLDIDSVYFEKNILPANADIPKAELKEIIRENYRKLFKYQSKPPSWLQNPEWIIKNDKPLFFVGQLKLDNEAFHDEGAVYVFLNTDTGEIETIKQFY